MMGRTRTTSREINSLLRRAKLSDAFFNWEGHEACDEDAMYEDPLACLKEAAQLFMEETAETLDHTGWSPERYAQDYLSRI